MHFIYIDDSGDEATRAYAALAVPEVEWKSNLALIKDYRRSMKAKYGIFVTVELHATDFVGGRGRIGARMVPKGLRCQIFKDTLTFISTLPGMRIFNAMGKKDSEALIFERLMTRINNTMKTWGSNAVIIHDEGKDYTSLVRRMSIYNPIQSKYGGWPDGNLYKNIPLKQILEDIIFRDSEDSYFVQLADFAAYALSRSEYILASKAKYELEKHFHQLEEICTPECFAKDPRKLGIIREI